MQTDLFKQPNKQLFLFTQRRKIKRSFRLSCIRKPSSLLIISNCCYKKSKFGELYSLFFFSSIQFNIKLVKIHFNHATDKFTRSNVSFPTKSSLSSSASINSCRFSSIQNQSITSTPYHSSLTFQSNFFSIRSLVNMDKRYKDNIVHKTCKVSNQFPMDRDMLGATCLPFVFERAECITPMWKYRFQGGVVALLIGLAMTGTTLGLALGLTSE